MDTGVMRLKLNAICPGTINFLVVGIIIAKQNPKVILSKKGILIRYYFLKCLVGTK